jgi:hypothetical protein
MKADITRKTFRKKKHYSKVNMQQGRVQVDADWNEQIDIQVHHDRTSLRDIIGETGAPHDNAGFKIEPSGNSYRIGAGQYYVDGILCENESEIDAKDQADLPSFGEHVAVPAKLGVYLIYLDVWERHLTYLDDKEMREVALGGTDTGTRTKIVWQVKALRVPDDIEKYNCSISFNAWEEETAESTGTLEARAKPTAPTSEPCELPPGAGYRRTENQLYRVEIHNKGEAGNGATFKWSRENGIVVTKVTDDIVASENKIPISDTGRDSKLGFARGQWVEITDDRHELWGVPGTFVQLDEVRDNTLFFKPDTIEGEPITKDNFPLNFNPKVRRWDSPNGLLKVSIPSTNDGYIELEDGVQIKFGEGKKYKTGDCWLIPARTVTGDIEWPRTGDNTPDALPSECTKHHFCRLALLSYSTEDGGGEEEGSFGAISDCRKIFPAITNLTMLYYIGGDGQQGSLDEVLPYPLEAGVARGNIPVKGAKVQFTETGNGRLGSTASQLNDKSLILSTNDEGRVKCYWKLAPDVQPQHQVEAVLLDDEGQKKHLPLVYSATVGRTGATPTLEPTMWTHGTSVQTESLQNIRSIFRRGWGTVIEGSHSAPNVGNWFHFAIPTPAIVSDRRLRIRNAMLVFKTGGRGVFVKSIHVWDGVNIIAGRDDLNLSGNHPLETFPVPNTPEVRFGIGISVGVVFSIGDVDAPNPITIEFNAAGADFF